MFKNCLPHYSDHLGSASWINATKNTYRAALQKATGKLGKGYETHHTLPLKHRDKFEKLGINIDESGNVVWRKTKNHQAGNAKHGTTWNIFFKRIVNPQKNKFYNNAILLKKKYGLKLLKGKSQLTKFVQIKSKEMQHGTIF